LIATTLGVRRESVSIALRRLKSLQLIELRRRQIQVLDEKALELQACGCYPIVCEYLGYTARSNIVERADSE
jgi:hypothetical protein